MSFTPLQQAVIEGNSSAAIKLTKSLCEEGLSASAILNDQLVSAMTEVGRLMKSGEYFLPEVLMSAKTMRESVEVLRPMLVSGGTQPKGRIVIGTVKGDLHDIGKNLVVMMLEGRGFQVVDLGISVEPEKFLSSLKENQAQILGLSALLTSTMPEMQKIIESLKTEGLRGQVKVIVGGAPVNQAYADSIEADGYAPDAASAADLADRLILSAQVEAIKPKSS